jgi:hypothetical protein
LQAAVGSLAVPPDSGEMIEALELIKPKFPVKDEGKVAPSSGS